jgi:hypothetical protein
MERIKYEDIQGAIKLHDYNFCEDAARDIMNSRDLTGFQSQELMEFAKNELPARYTDLQRIELFCNKMVDIIYTITDALPEDCYAQRQKERMIAELKNALLGID